MKRILAINSVVIIIFIYLCSVFYESAESLMLSFGLVFLFAFLSNYILKIMKQNNNSIFVVFLLLSFYMFFLKGLLIFINNKFSIYYKLNISFYTVDYIKTFIMIIIYYIIIFITYGSIEKKKIDLSKQLNTKGLKIRLIAMITFLAVFGKYYFSVKYNYGLPGQIPSVFIISGLGGIVYLILSELSRIGLFYLFISANVMKNKMYLYISVSLMLLHSSLSALNGIKGEAVFIAIGILVYYFVFSSKKISFTNITIIFFASVIFFTVADSLRNSIDYTDISIKYLETFIKVVRRSTGFDSLLNLVKYYDGQLFSIYNPNVDPIRLFTVQIAGVPENAVSAAAPTLFGYTMIKFGYFISLIIAGIYGFLLKCLDKFIKRKLEHTGNIIFAVFYVMTVFFLIDFFFEGNLILAFKRYFVSTFIMTIIYLLKLSKNIKINYEMIRRNSYYENSVDNA